MAQYKKVYVAAYVRVDEQGAFSPVAVEWQDGRKFLIDKITDDRMCLPPHVTAVFTRRFTVLIGGYTRHLYYETFTNQWFVEKLFRW